MRNELAEFFGEKGKLQFQYLFQDTEHIVEVAYVVDIFGYLNELNLSLQGQHVWIRLRKYEPSNKIAALNEEG